jgi:DNA invertase Pin-like site-specific DNA recombinase
MNPADKETLRHRAAAYVRMSTDHQQYSTSNQMDFIREDARRRGLEIVKMFSDEGKSGLDFEGRDALKAMLAEIEAGQAG